MEWMRLNTLRFVTDTGKIYVTATHGPPILTFNPGDITAVPVLDFGHWVPVFDKSEDVLVQEDALYVLQTFGKVYEYAFPAPLELE